MDSVFLNKDIGIDETDNISMINLLDMMTFDRVDEKQAVMNKYLL